ncbi:hypothetical protein PEDI_31340 [Persicobacter diffluens]|uniref:Uncharacterized protein n=1 Tax=Persicobacter diffluens TaxID=981 RepID=A0AAN4W1H1_9BACT|nr:hypothetical protein PEDI_31340 [Persicobacter diffluens]
MVTHLQFFSGMQMKEEEIGYPKSVWLKNQKNYPLQPDI